MLTWILYIGFIPLIAYGDVSVVFMVVPGYFLLALITGLFSEETPHSRYFRE